MTPEQKRAIRLLQGCTFLPGSYAKRFVRDMGSRLHLEERVEDWEYTLTERQAAFLMKLLHSYRRQHGGCFCPECVNPVFLEALKS